MAEARRGRFAGAEALAQDVSPFVGRAVEQGERLRGSVAALFPEGGVRQGPETGLEMFGRRSLPDVGSFPMPGGGTLGEKMQDPATQEAIEFILGGPLMAMTPLTAMVRAFHGTPHKFTKFSKAKVGSGQGAQTFGHGLYFAENPKVANQYRKELASSSQVDDLIGRAGIRDQELSSYVSTRLSAEGDPSVTARGLERFADTMDDVPEDAAKLRMVASDMRDNPEAWRSAMEGGSFMEVTIDADPEDFLDWDKPLSQQSPKVREALARQVEELPEPALTPAPQIGTPEFADFMTRPLPPDEAAAFDAFEASRRGRAAHDSFQQAIQRARNDLIDAGVDPDEVTGAAVYRQLERSMGSEQASEALREAGIPGIRYLDQGSRGPAEFPFRVKFKSDGADAFLASTMEEAQEFIADNPKLFEIVDNSDEFTRNIVLFDDSLVEIQSINDVPLPKAR